MKRLPEDLAKLIPLFIELVNGIHWLIKFIITMQIVFTQVGDLHKRSHTNTSLHYHVWSAAILELENG